MAFPVDNRDCEPVPDKQSIVDILVGGSQVFDSAHAHPEGDGVPLVRTPVHHLKFGQDLRPRCCTVGSAQALSPDKGNFHGGHGHFDSVKRDCTLYPLLYVIAVFMQFEFDVQPLIYPHVQHGFHQRDVAWLLRLHDCELLLFCEGADNITGQLCSNEVPNLA